MNWVLRWSFVVIMGSSLIACLRDAEPSAEEMAVRTATEQMLSQVSDQDYAAVWESLHPAYQSIIDREQFVECGEQWPPIFTSFEVTEVEMTEYQADELGRVNAGDVAVRFQTTDAFRESAGTNAPITRRILWVTEHDHWTWFPSTGALQTFREGACGGIPWPAGSADLAEP